MIPTTNLNRTTLGSAVALVAIALASSAAAQDTLIEGGSTWRFLDDGSNMGTAWSQPGFSDSSWALGDSEFGFGDGDERTVIDVGPNPSDKHITTYFRQTFQVADPSAYVALEVRLKRDDGALVHLNGVEVVRDNLPAGPITADTTTLNSVGLGPELAFYPHYIPTTGLVAGTNVIAVELHLSDPGADDGSFDLRLIGHTVPSVVRGPYVQMVTPTEATLRFRTILPTVGKVWFGSAAGDFSGTVSESQSGLDHELRITDLDPSTKYFYAVGSPAGQVLGGDEDHWFETAPEVGSRQPFRVWALGDSGTYTGNQTAVRDAYLTHGGGRPTDVMLMLGDNAYQNGTDLEYQLGVFEIYGETIRQTPMWSARGNHERIESDYFDAFTLPDQAQGGGVPSGVEDYYSFDWGNVHFICLDTFATDRDLGDPMYQWCLADLQSTTQDWIVAFMHHPIYSKGSNDSDASPNSREMREVFGQLLEDHGVALVLSGHSHAYERSMLLDRHQGSSSTFDTNTHAVDSGLGREILGTGGYNRAPGPNGGAVYVVSGSAGQISSNGDLQHPAMVWSERDYGSVVLDVTGGRMDVTFLDDDGAKKDWFTIVDSTWDGSFCNGSVNGEGCVATLSTSGTPSLSSSQPFEVRASKLRTKATSMLIYSMDTEDTPFMGGRMCLAQPFFRTAPGFSGGNAPCSGNLTVDFRPMFGSSQHMGLEVGAKVYCHVWYRDTTPFHSSISDGLMFTVLP